jgi:hypothetical protein
VCLIVMQRNLSKTVKKNRMGDYRVIANSQF